MTSYTRILDLLHEVEPEDNYLNQIRIPKLSDKQLIALNLAAECLGIDSERYLFNRLPEELCRQIDRSVYNRRRRKLSLKINQLRQRIASKVQSFDDYHMVDSIALEVCRFSRARRARMCR